MSTPKERLLIFIRHLGIENSKFEQLTGLGNGYINNLQGIPRSNTLNKISKIYPELNIDWIKTEKGEMLRPTILQTNQNGDNINGQSITVNMSEADKLYEIIKEKDKEIKEKNNQIQRLLDIISKMQE